MLRRIFGPRWDNKKGLEKRFLVFTFKKIQGKRIYIAEQSIIFGIY